MAEGRGQADGPWGQAQDGRADRYSGGLALTGPQPWTERLRDALGTGVSQHFLRFPHRKFWLATRALGPCQKQLPSVLSARANPRLQAESSTSQTTPGGHCRARAQPLRVTQERKPLAECTQSRPAPSPLAQPCCPWSQESLLPPTSLATCRDVSAKERRCQCQAGPLPQAPAICPSEAEHTLTGKSRWPSYRSWRKLGSSPRGLVGCRGSWSVGRFCASSPHISAHVPSVSVALECPYPSVQPSFPRLQTIHMGKLTDMVGVQGLIPLTRAGALTLRGWQRAPLVLWGAMHTVGRCGLVSSSPGLYPPQARSCPSCDNCDNKRNLPVLSTHARTLDGAHGGHTQCGAQAQPAWHLARFPNMWPLRRLK